MKTYFIFVVFCGFTILPITLVFRIVGWEWVRWDFWKGTSMIHWPSQDSKLDNVLGYLEWPWLRSRGRKGHQGLNNALYKRADDSSSTHSHMHAWVTVNSGTGHILQTHCVWCMHWSTMNIMNEENYIGVHICGTSSIEGTRSRSASASLQLWDDKQINSQWPVFFTC